MLERLKEEKQVWLQRAAKLDIELTETQSDLDLAKGDLKAASDWGKEQEATIKRQNRRLRSLDEVMDAVDVNLQSVSKADGTIDPGRLVLQLAQSVMPLVSHERSDPREAFENLVRAVDRDER